MVQASELHGIPVLDCLTDAQRDRLSRMAADIWAQKDELLICEGDTPYFFVFCWKAV